MPPVDVLVVGAGMAGLTAARALVDAGLSVTVVDKGRGVGGRLATRRMGDARLDHGAQFFTARSDEFRAQVDRWTDAGVAREWCRGFRQPADGHPRYVGTNGMTDVATDLAAGIDVRLATRVEAVRAAGAGWDLLLAAAARPGDAAPGDAAPAGAVPLRARAVLMTAPVPQTLDLLAAGGVDLPQAAAAALGAIRYSPTLAALVTLRGPSAVPAPGGVQLDEGPISWVGDNVAKGISAWPAVTLHASPSTSTDRWDDPPERVLADLLDAGRRWLGPPTGPGRTGPEGAVAEAQLMRWRYAQPTASHPERALVAVERPAPLVCAGDAFGEAKVEGAARSGWAAATALIERLTG